MNRKPAKKKAKQRQATANGVPASTGQGESSFWYTGGIGLCAVLFVGAGVFIGTRFAGERQGDVPPTGSFYAADTTRPVERTPDRTRNSAANEPPMLGLPAQLKRIQALTTDADRPGLAPPPPPEPARHATEPEAESAAELAMEEVGATATQTTQLSAASPTKQVAALQPQAAPAAAAKQARPTAFVPQAITPPAVRMDADAPWRKFAAPVPVGAGPRIAIVIDDLGLNRDRSIRAARLPGPITLSFLPYAEGLPAFVEWARRQGAASGGTAHEIMLHLPMEPMDRQNNNPGPNALLTSLDEAELLRRLRWGLDRFGSFVGVNNHMGSRFTMDAPRMRVVMNELRARGLLWMDSRTIGSSVGEQVAHETGVPTAGRDVFLDNEHHASAVVTQLHLAEEVARRKGEAIAIGHPHDGTLAALEQWIPQAKARGFVLVPVTAIVARRSGGV